MKVKEDIRPISYLKTHTAAAVLQVNDTHRPLYITQNGEPAAVMLDALSYEKIIHGLDLLKIISQGEKDISSGRLTEQTAFFKALGQKFF